jgi:hypothetical protein
MQVPVLLQVCEQPLLQLSSSQLPAPEHTIEQLLPVQDMSQLPSPSQEA